MLDFDELLETALWSTTDGDCNLDDAKYSDYIPSEAFKLECETLMAAFMDKARVLFTDDELENSPIEHDLWLTLHGHGAGFWDGDYEKGDELTLICKELGGGLEDSLRDDAASQIEA
jgi:hypothetical protein